jgi:hypothetical protein
MGLKLLGEVGSYGREMDGVLAVMVEKWRAFRGFCIQN